jgi:hypothetical protein
MLREGRGRGSYDVDSEAVMVEYGLALHPVGEW